MYSLNAPVPGRVARIAADLRPALSGMDRLRDRYTLVVKRLGDGEFARLETRVRRLLEGTPPVRARVRGVDAFEDPPRGPAPVVYLAVESSGLVEVHDRLVAELGAIEGLEGDDYVPHVTLARGGDPAVARRLADREIEPVAWTITELELYDATRETGAGRISLPA